MRLVLAFLIISVLLTISGFAQQPEISVKLSETVPMVSVWHPEFTKMCQNLAFRVGAESDADRIMIRPRYTKPSEEKHFGELWLVSSGEKEVVLRAAEFPPIFQKLKGPVVLDFVWCTCFLRDGYYFSGEHIVFLALGNEEAKALAAVLGK